VVSRKTAMRFIIIVGIVSLFADTTYEGGRSANGLYLAVLGASGTAAGFVGGFGEFIGYGVRFFSGRLSDRTRRYWTITFCGYLINLFAVPALALAGNWPFAAALIILERFGKGVRNPPRDAMLSHATQEVGHGWGFGIHEALDQTGAMLGPIIVTVILVTQGFDRIGLQTAFALLLVPAILALATLTVARFLYPRPHDLEAIAPSVATTTKFPKPFWTYLAGASLVGAGFADFTLVAYHFGTQQTVPGDLVPFLYAVAMGVDALASLAFGRLFDRWGIRVLVLGVVLSFLFAPLVFLGGEAYAVVGMVLWGFGLGSQEAIMSAAVAGMVSADRRGTAFGTFNTGFGMFWFAGSAMMGILYDVNVPALVVFSMAAQLLAIPFFLWTARLTPRSKPPVPG
jgi:predicted MFS family arabinose efflux permease